jgi:hypothetical protein
MKTLVCLLILMGTMCAQEKRSEPYRMNSDVLGESLEEFRRNNPWCVVEDTFTMSFGGPAVRRLGCIPENNLVSPTVPDTYWEPDTTYYGIPLWTRGALFNGEDGLVRLSFEFRSADAVRLEKQFRRDVGPPSNPFPIWWGNGTSTIILWANVEPSKYGLLELMQDKFFGQMYELAKAKVQQNAPLVSKDPAQK